jgi:hypothetical protein
MNDTIATPQARESNKKYSVFFSHKVNDQKVTSQLKELLAHHTQNIDYFISEDIEKGTRWREIIAKRLNLANFLVLVFTDPDEDWEWCLYETGFFDALSQVPDSTRRTFCLHATSTPPPSPIANLQSVPATKRDVKQWLSELFRYTEQPAAPLPKLASKICKLFENNRKPIYCQRSIDITVNCASLASPDDLPEDTVIEGQERLMEELFGSYNGKLDWKSAKDRFRKFPNSAEVNLNTLKELSRAVYAIHNRNIVHPTQGILFVEQGPKRYRPIISLARELTNDRIRCQIALTEEVGGQLQNVDNRLGALLTSIRLAVRIRWEIVRPFASNVRAQARVDARKLRFDLQTCFNNVFLEAEFRGYFSEKDILNAFERDEDKKKVLRIMEKWKTTYPKIWRGIGFLDVTETFGEVSEQPMTPQDRSSLESGLRELESLNRDFLSLAVARAEVLIQRELAVLPQKGLRRPRRNGQSSVKRKKPHLIARADLVDVG